MVLENPKANSSSINFKTPACIEQGWYSIKEISILATINIQFLKILLLHSRKSITAIFIFLSCYVIINQDHKAWAIYYLKIKCVFSISLYALCVFFRCLSSKCKCFVRYKYSSLCLKKHELHLNIYKTQINIQIAYFAVCICRNVHLNISLIIYLGFVNDTINRSQLLSNISVLNTLFRNCSSIIYKSH